MERLFNYSKPSTSDGFQNILAQMKIPLYIVLVSILACTATVAGEESVGDQAMETAKTMEGMIAGMQGSMATDSDINNLATQAELQSGTLDSLNDKSMEFWTKERDPDTEIQTKSDTIIIDGVEYAVIENIDPVTGEIIKQVVDPNGIVIKQEYIDRSSGTTLVTEYDSDGNMISMNQQDSEGNSIYKEKYDPETGAVKEMEYKDPTTNTALKTEYDASGNALSNSVVNEETGQQTYKAYDPETGAVTETEYRDPETNVVLKTEYDASGNIASNIVVDQETNEATEINYNDDGSKEYVVTDYNTGQVVITEVDEDGEVTDQTVTTESDLEEPVTHTCPNTGQSEIDIE